MWYYMRNNNRIGPVSDEEMYALINNGTIIRQTPVWKEGMQDWAQAHSSELSASFSSIPPAPPSYSGLTTYQAAVASYEPQSFRKLWLWYTWLVALGFPLCFIVIGLIPLIAGGVICWIMLYRFWSVIQDGKARTSPGKAVGFCFIPFFNFYWVYVAFVGLAKDMNLYCDERSIAGPRVNDGLALTWFIFMFLGIIPYLGWIVAIANLVIGIILFKQFSDVAARILETKEK